jgi:ATP-binding cassette subfamily G (WHITE) protein 2 (SNQ2)
LNSPICAALLSIRVSYVLYNANTDFDVARLYYLDPFTYLIGALLEPVVWDVEVQCKSSELASIPLPSNTTCGDYMAEFLSSAAGYVVDTTSTTSCEYCQYSTGADYLKTMNINESYYGWRNVSSTGRLSAFLLQIANMGI